MKKKISYLFFLLLFSLKLSAVSVNNSDTIPVPSNFKQVVPDLEILQSAFPKIKSENEEDYVKTIYNEKDKSMTIIALSLTTEKLKELLKEGMVVQPDWRNENRRKDPNYQWRNNHKKIYDNVNIYCGSLVMNKDIWIPECNITIHADNIVTNDKNKTTFFIISSPLDYKEVWSHHEISKNAPSNGKNGANAGNINLRFNNLKIFLGLETEGSKGTSIYIPDFKEDDAIDWPATTKEKKYACMMV